MPRHDDDEELCADLRGGDTEAGRELFRRHAPAVLRFFRGKVPENAEDLTQEVFARFLANTNTDVEVRPFLFGIARNVLRESLRSRDRCYDEGVTSIVDLAHPSSTQLRERQALLRALQVLPVGHQIAIELHYWEGFSSAELGQALGVTASAARSRLEAARAKLVVSLSKAFPLRSASEFADLESWALRLRETLER